VDDATRPPASRSSALRRRVVVIVFSRSGCELGVRVLPTDRAPHDRSWAGAEVPACAVCEVTLTCDRPVGAGDAAPGQRVGTRRSRHLRGDRSNIAHRQPGCVLSTLRLHVVSVGRSNLSSLRRQAEDVRGGKMARNHVEANVARRSGWCCRRGATPVEDVSDLVLADRIRSSIGPLVHQLETYDHEIVRLDARIAGVFNGHPGYVTIQQIHGVGPVFAAIFVAEIGDVTRFDNARQISSWADMTPRHRESDVKAHRGAITKQGPRLVRWAAVEAVSRNHKIEPIHDIYVRVGQRRGVNKGRVAAARKPLHARLLRAARSRGSMPRHRAPDNRSGVTLADAVS